MIVSKKDIRDVTKSRFARLAKYLLNHQGNDNRVENVQFSNVAEQDPDFAIAEILATQAKNTRAKGDKTYHLVVSFREGELPDPQTLKEIEQRLCGALGLGAHQRLSVLHHDTDNLHLHLAINKIHPEKYTMIEPYYDKLKLNKVCAELEKKYGLKADNHVPKTAQAQGKANDMERAGGMESLIGWVRRECGERLKQAKTWEELHRILREHNLVIKERGRGLVITDGQTEIKASSVAREMSRAKLEAKLGFFENAYSDKEQSDDDRFDSRVSANSPGVDRGTGRDEGAHRRTGAGGAGEYFIHRPEQPDAFPPGPLSGKRLQRLSERHLVPGTTGEPAEDLLQPDAQPHRSGDRDLRRDSAREEKGVAPKAPETKRYEKAPLSQGAAGTALWNRYKDEIEERKNARKDALHDLKRRRGTEAALAKEEYRKEISQLKYVRSPTARLILRMLASARKNFALEKANMHFEEAKKELSSHQDWNAWLKAQARNGNSEALAFLQARREKAEGKYYTGEVQKALVTKTIQAVTGKGTVIGEEQIRETSAEIIMHHASDEAMIEGLRLAVEKFSGPIEVTGDAAFKANSITAAVQGKLALVFADETMEKTRKKILREQNFKDAVGKYVEQRNLLKEKNYDIKEHRAYAAKDAGEKIFEGIRRMDGYSMALLKDETGISVLPITTRENAKVFFDLKKGSAINVDAQQRVTVPEGTRERRQAEQPQDAPVYIKVPYDDRSAAKDLGAQWVAAKQSWSVPTWMDPELFLERWPQHDPEQTMAEAAERKARTPVYIQVPYQDRAEAKELGAQWVAVKQSWSVPTWMDPELFLEKWPQHDPEQTMAEAAERKAQYARQRSQGAASANATQQESAPSRQDAHTPSETLPAVKKGKRR